MGQRVRWEVEKDLREHNIDLDDGDNDEPLDTQSDAPPAILTFVWHNRKALVYNLQQNRIIRCAQTSARRPSVGKGHC